MKYLLDTDTISFALRKSPGVVERLLRTPPSEIAVSAITVSELRFGAAKRKAHKLHRLIDTFLAPIAEIPFDSQAAATYGEIAAVLQARGTPIGIKDTQIAAHALSLGIVLVTHNERRFRQVDGLEIEDWI